MWFFVAGWAFIFAAVISDPWGRRPGAAAVFLLGAAMIVLAIAT